MADNAKYRKEVGARIRAARESSGLSLRKLAALMGERYQSIQSWESGRNLPMAGKVARLSELLNTTTQHLLGSQNEMPAFTGDNVTSLGTRSKDLVRRVPVVSWETATQVGMSATVKPFGEGEGYRPVIGVGERAFLLRVIGNSMEPRFPAGCLICIDPDAPTTSGDYVLAKPSPVSQVMFAQLVDDGVRRFLRPENSQFPALELGPGSTVCGRVMQVIQEL